VVQALIFGAKMKSRKKYFAILLAIIILLVCFFVVFNLPASSSIGPENKIWLTGWDYRKSHDIQGSLGAGVDYQIKLIVHYQKGTDSGSDVYLGLKCQRNFDDVRFTAADSLTLLDYWLETKVDGDHAVFWVKINSNLDFNQTIYIYYSNTTVASTSDVQKTFPFADDFSGSSLNNAQWRTFGSGKATVSGGVCTLESVPGDRGWIYILGKTSVGTNYAVRFSSFVIEQGEYRYTHHGFATIFNSSDSTFGRIDEYPNYITASQESIFHAWSLRTRSDSNTSRLDLSNNAPVVGAFCTYEIQRNGSTNVLLTSNDVFQGTLNTNVPTIKMNAMFSADNGGSNLYSVTAVDWVIIRKYVVDEPLQGPWGVQETVLLNNIFGFTLRN
jgi:hypothetical protein